MSRSPAPLYVVSDIHGHRSQLREELHAAGLVDDSGRWSGGRTRLWFLGDYVDRGPDGIGVIDDVRALSAQAAPVGGEVGALLGNHEVQLLAAHRFGTAAVTGWDEPDGFRGGWARFGGRDEDLLRLTPEHVTWIEGLPAVAVVDGFLLVHSDTGRYLDFGTGADQVNATVAQSLTSYDTDAWLAFGERMSDRGTFRGADPARPDDAVAVMLHALGGEVLVHGHSTLTKYFGVAPAEVREALRYADNRVIAIDGGVYEGGRILLTRLI